MNVRSYRKNRSLIEEVILSDKYDILIIQETWMKQPVAIPDTGYKVIDMVSNQSKGLGIRILIRHSI